MIEELCKWLERTPASVFVASTTWIVPTVQSIHILSVGVVFASMSMLSFRLLNIWGRRQTVSTRLRPALSCLWPGLTVLLLTGVVMIVAEPERELLNRIFLLKMTLVAIAALIGLALRRSVSRRPQWWDASAASVVPKCAGLLLSALWVAIIVCGRWIAYTQ